VRQRLEKGWADKEEVEEAGGKSENERDEVVVERLC
jgi:hypothetical protein